MRKTAGRRVRSCWLVLYTTLAAQKTSTTAAACSAAEQLKILVSIALIGRERVQQL